MEIFVLMMDGQYVNGQVRNDGYDVFGLYSSMEKAEEAKEWRKREDGRYQGVRYDLVYENCIIVKRIVDWNLPR